MLKFYVHRNQTIMYTHVEVDESTLTQVMALGAFASKKAAINSALAEMAKLLKRRELLAQRGKLPWTGDLNALRAERNSRDTTLK
jgi:Arc/MetJ family transcription regulator